MNLALSQEFCNGGQFAGVRILSPDAVAEMGRNQTTTLSFNLIPTKCWRLGSDEVAQPGLAEWHKLPLTGASVTISGASAWKLYDVDLKLLEAGEGTENISPLPIGFYLMLYGAPDAMIRVTLNP